MAKAKAGPVVTDNGNLLLDWTFDLTELKQKLSIDIDKDLWQAVNTKLLSMAGVVDTGLFVEMAKIAYFGDANGEVTKLVDNPNYFSWKAFENEDQNILLFHIKSVLPTFLKNQIIPFQF